ncbi:MAG: protein kinase [Alphaproteobacteria bacterium]|nr:protein kinase [Alphaproteobacteria bacterium]
MSNEHRNALPQGYQLDDYVINRILGAGGFGITYLAHEKTLDRSVAIKEFLPRDLAVRGEDGGTIHPISSSDQEDFIYGLERFREEARTLVNFRHPNIIPVHRLMEENGTAYLVMEYEDGDSLQTVVEREGTLDEFWIKGILLPILDGLEQVHQAGFLHRDIKPGNIYIRSDGSPVLIDFGSARQALGAKSRSMTAVVSVGYAPMEQYSVRGKHSAATDIYALGATAYRAVTGVRPPDAVERIEDDPYVSAAVAAKGSYSDALLAAIDWALRMDAAARPQTIAEWRAVLTGEATAPTVVGSADIAPTQAGSAMTARTGDTAATGEPHHLVITSGTGGKGSEATMLSQTPTGGSRVLPWVAGGLTVLIAASASGAGWLWYEAREDANRASQARNETERMIVEESERRRRAEQARRRAEVRRRAAEEALKRSQEIERQRREEAEAARREAEGKRTEAARKRAEAERKRIEEAKRSARGSGRYGLTIINKCNRISAAYVAYRVRGDSGEWITRGWIRVNRGGRAFRRLPTRNRVIYLYARGGGLQWGAQGQPGAIRRWVRSRSFAHATGRLRGAGARLVWFHKKSIAQNTTGYEWTLICTN